MHGPLPATPQRGWPEARYALRLCGDFTGHRTGLGRFGGIGPMLIGCGHDEVGARSCRVALEQGKQFEAQAVAARCGEGVHGEEGDHDFRNSMNVG